MLSKLSALQEGWSVKLAESWRMLELEAQIRKSSGRAEYLGSAVAEQNHSWQKTPTVKFSCTSLKQKGAQT